MFRPIKIPVRYCERCNQIMLNMDLKRCLFCGNHKEEEPLPPRHIYRELPMQDIGRKYYQTDINLDYYLEEE